MQKHFYFKLIKFILLLILVIGFIACKKKDDTPTAPAAPSVYSSNASWIGPTWATINGNVKANNSFTHISFEYGTTTDYGNVINGIPDTASGNTNIVIRAELTDLTKRTTYHYRIKGVNGIGTSYGVDFTFMTVDSTGIVINFNPDLTYGSLADYDGRLYKTIQIGAQTWMAENLKTTKLNDGTEIPFVTNENAWMELTTPGYCWYNNDSVAYGALYNWYTINTEKLCPSGWHVPSDEEWTVLTDYLGGQNVSGGKMKETGITHWNNPNVGATNESGFTAIPSGYRYRGGVFSAMGAYGYWWTSDPASSTDAYYRDTYYGYIFTDRSGTNKKSGLSVRCLKD